MKLNFIKKLVNNTTPATIKNTNEVGKSAVKPVSYHAIRDSRQCISNINKTLVNVNADTKKMFKFSDIFFDKGIAKNADGFKFSGTVKDTLSNGKEVEILYNNGKWIKSTITNPSNNFKIEKFAKYDDSTNKLKSISKIVLLNDEPKMAYVTKISEGYVKTNNNLNINSMKLTPFKDGQKLSQDELLRCYGTDSFSQYNPAKYKKAGILASDKSHVFVENKKTGKWEHQGVVDNLQKLYQQ